MNCPISLREENLLDIKELTTRNLLEEANQLINKYSDSNNAIKKAEPKKFTNAAKTTKKQLSVTFIP